MKKISIFLLLVVLRVIAYTQTAPTYNHLSNSLSDAGFSIEIIPHEERYKINSYDLQAMQVSSGCAYIAERFTDLKRISVKFYIKNIYDKKYFKYRILTNIINDSTPLQPLPGADKDSLQGKVYYLHNIDCDNRFIRIELVNTAVDNYYHSYSVSTIPATEPQAAYFQKNNHTLTAINNNDGISRKDLLNNTADYDVLVLLKTKDAPDFFHLGVVRRVAPFYQKVICEYNNREWKMISDSLLDIPEIKEKYQQGFRYVSVNPLGTVSSPGKYSLYTHFRKGEKIQRINFVNFRLKATLNQLFLLFIIYILPVLILATIVLLIIRKKNKKKLLKEQQFTKEAKLKLESIRSQLNPHFVFNALSGIQNLVNKNENEKAGKYLHTFSRLTRSILDGSTQEMISIVNEINMLEDYLKMEQLRFGFQYSIYTDENIDKNNIEIPSMILQPFVENAVKHGASSLKETGKINIEYKKSGSNLVVSVADNGEGFDTSKEYCGMGLQLCKNRISLLNSLHKTTPIDLQISSSAKGTSILITLKNWLS